MRGTEMLENDGTEMVGPIDGTEKVIPKRRDRNVKDCTFVEYVAKFDKREH